MADTYGLTGNYAAIQDQAQRAYEIAKNNVATQRQQLLQKYGYDPSGKVDSSNPYGLYQQEQKSYLDSQANMGIKVGDNGQFSIDTANPTGQLSKLQRDSGMNFQFDGSGNPTDLIQSGDNPYGQWQELLGSEGSALNSARDDALSRGLGTKGVGAQGLSALGFQQAGDRQNFRNQLLDQLTSQAKQAKGLIYQHGLDQFNIGSDLASQLGGLDQQGYQAEVDKGNTLGSGYLQDLIDRIKAGDFTAVTDDGTGDGGTTNPPPNTRATLGVPAATARTIANSPAAKASATALAVAKKAGANPAAAALAARSAALNVQYGLNKKKK